MLPVTAFFDFTCPFSYVTVTALDRLAAGEVEVRARALELFPAPGPLPAPREEEGWEELVRPLAAELGLPLRVPGFRPRTHKAHEAAALAAMRGAGAAMRAAIFAAYWGEERDIGRIDVLSALAGAAALDPDTVRIELDIDRYGEAVLRDQALAARLRVTQTPTLFLGTGPDARVLVGVRSPEELEREIASHPHPTS